MSSFADRVLAARSVHGQLVAGLDSSGEVLRAWGLGDDAEGLERFADIVGLTNQAYAEAYLGPGAPMGADAVTVRPYLGLAAMDAFVDRADAYGAGVPIVVRSTNPEGRAIQAAAGKTGTVEATLLREIGQVNARLAPGRLGPVGAVIGPGHDADLDLRGAQAIFLAPGLGAQGATVADVARCFASCPERVLPSASRSLLASGPDRRQLRDSAGRLGDDLARALARP